MTKLHYSLTFVLIASFATALHAQQEIRLKSGTIFFGEARFEGDEAIVTVGESELRFPRDEIALIQGGGAAPGVSQHQQALPEHRRLLNAALEAKLLNGATKEVVGLLAQAAQLAPDDPQIRFWYVTSLVDAGFGKAAEEALASHRDEVAQAYPGTIDRLIARIESRKQLEGLPPAMVARIDRLSAAAEQRTDSDDDERHHAIAFRVVDQHGKPLAANSMHLEGYANNPELEAFADGYFIYSFRRSRGNNNDLLTLTVEEVGVRTAQFELTLANAPLAEPKNIDVHRQSDDDRVPLRISVTGPDDNPLVNARVSLRANLRRGSSSALQSEMTNEQGVVELMAFPNSYIVDVTAEGFHPESVSIDAKASREELSQIKAKLYPLLTASLRAAWRMEPVEAGGNQPPGEVTEGEGTLPVGARGIPRNDWATPFRSLRAVQVQNRLMLQLDPHQYGGGWNVGSPATWLRALDVKAEEGSQHDAVAKQFGEIDLKEMARYKKELKPIELASTPQRPYPQIPLEADRILVGEMPFLDHRTGRPGVMAFKLMLDGDVQSAVDRK